MSLSCSLPYQNIARRSLHLAVQKKLGAAIARPVKIFQKIACGLLNSTAPLFLDGKVQARKRYVLKRMGAAEVQNAHTSFANSST